MAKKKRKGKAGSAAPAATTPEPAAGAAEPASTASATANTATPASAPVAPSALARAFILAVVAYELLMPLRYYLGGRGYDERFSWRMFSTVRLQKCKVQVHDVLDRDGTREDRPVALEQVVQVAWIGMLERFRKPVIEKLLHRRCEQAGVSEARLERRCTDTDGTSLAPVEMALDCKSKRLTASGGAP